MLSNMLLVKEKLRSEKQVSWELLVFKHNKLKVNIAENKMSNKNKYHSR